MWHAAHQYELFKLGHHFTLVTDSGAGIRDQWDYGQRPLPYNVQFKPLHEVSIKDYDFAILPFEVPMFHREQGLWHMLELTKAMPRAAICCGLPLYDECERASMRVALRELLQDVHVVCPSHQAQKEWGFHKSSVIWHGFSPYEFPPGRHEKACLTLPRAAFEMCPLCAGKEHANRVMELLKDVCEIECAAPPAPHPGYEKDNQEWAVAGFQNYTRYIGDFTVYLNPTVHSPMPHRRAEAMMTGTIPVSLRNHDVDMFIQNGVNGFNGNSAEELAEHVGWLLQHDKQRGEISRNARMTAMDIFNIDRQLAAWSTLIAEVIGACS
jgi:glycosyltransferase involved in cell wall biosynthesis